MSEQVALDPGKTSGRDQVPPPFISPAESSGRVSQRVTDGPQEHPGCSCVHRRRRARRTGCRSRPMSEAGGQEDRGRSSRGTSISPVDGRVSELEQGKANVLEDTFFKRGHCDLSGFVERLKETHRLSDPSADRANRSKAS